MKDKKAREPKWWKKLVSKIPQFRIKFLDEMEFTKEKAELICKLIPRKCPFNRQYWVGNTLILFIPPLCHFNPFYGQLSDLRLKAETFLEEGLHPQKNGLR